LPDPAAQRVPVLPPTHGTDASYLASLPPRPTPHLSATDLFSSELPPGSTFEDALCVSRKFLDFDVVAVADAEATARVARDPTCRVDCALACANLVEARRVGLEVFLQSRSDAIIPITYQPIEPDFVPCLPPSADLPPCIRTGLDPTATAARINGLSRGVDILLPDGFEPNYCVPPQAPDSASSLALELHVQADVAAGRAVVFPLEGFLALARLEGLPVNGSSCFLVRNTGKLLGRAVVNFSGKSPVNAPHKKPLLAALYGAIRLPLVQNYCTIAAAVHEHFPHEEIVCFKSDFSAWYKRVRVTIRSALLCVYVIRGSDGRLYVVVTLTSNFGCQDANSQSDLGSSVLEAREVYRAQHTYNISTLGAIYTDDSANFGPLYVAHAQIAALEADAVAMTGVGVMNASKLEIGPALTIIGWLFCNRTRTVSLSGRAYLKLLCALFHSLPEVLVAGVTSVSVLLLQRLRSYMFIATGAVIALRPYTRAAGDNIRNRIMSDKVYLSARTVADIAMWRTVFTVAFADARWLSVSWYIPPYIHRDKKGDYAAWSTLQAGRADYVLFCDAALQDGVHGTGAVAWRPRDALPFAVLAHDLPDLIAYITADGSSAEVHINILEAVAAVLMFAAFVLYIRDLGPTSYPVHCTRPFIHVHIWTDNTAALHWLSKNRSRTPFVNLLYCLFTQLQLLSGLVVTMGHKAGAKNFHADAVSRHYNCANGAALKAQILRPETLRWTLSSQWVSDMVTLSTDRSLPTCSLPRVALTHAERLFSSHSC
jgi:hypothetical protein